MVFASGYVVFFVCLYGAFRAILHVVCARL